MPRGKRSPHPDATRVLAAVARLNKVPGTDERRFAIVVANRWQHCGAGLRLPGRLLELRQADAPAGAA
jgi:hypothetical protein